MTFVLARKDARGRAARVAWVLTALAVIAARVWWTAPGAIAVAVVSIVASVVVARLYTSRSAP